MTDKLKQLLEFGKQQMALEAELAAAEAAVKAKKAEVLALSERTIPDLMKELELASFTMESGQIMELEESYAASIPKAKQDEAFAWLEDNGHGSLIKDQIIIWLDKHTPAGVADTIISNVQALLGSCSDDTIERKRSVHASTLKAFVNEQIEEGAEIPFEPFGIFHVKRSKLKVSRKAKSKVGADVAEDL